MQRRGDVKSRGFLRESRALSARSITLYTVACKIIPRVRKKSAVSGFGGDEHNLWLEVASVLSRMQTRIDSHQSFLVGCSQETVIGAQKRGWGKAGAGQSATGNQC